MNKFYFIVCLLAGVLGINKLFAQAPVLSYQTPQTFAIGQPVTPIPIANTGTAVSPGYYAQSSGVAGNGYYGYKDTTDAASASFGYPIGITQDPAGNVFIADANNNAIRKITPDGIVTTFAGGSSAGTTDGMGTAAKFNYPTGLASDQYGNIYVADYANNRIRKITPAGLVTTIASTGFSLPYGLAVDANNNIIVADTYNNLIKKVTQYGVVTVIAGNSGSTALTDGHGTAASFNLPHGVILDKTGNIYVTDWNHNAIRKITPAADVTTLTQTNLTQPTGITIDSLGTLYVTNGIGIISKIDPASGNTVNLAGKNDGVSYREGVDTSARFSGGDGVCYDPGGNLVIADAQNFLVRIVSLNGFQISPDLPAGLSMDNTGTISGTPDSASVATNYTVTGYSTTGNSSAVINVAVSNIAPQTITFNPIPNKTYGSADIVKGAVSTNSTIPITYTSSNTAVATILNDTTIHIAGVGTANITANQAAGPNFTAATPVTKSLTVIPATLTITANDQNKITGQSNPAFSFKYSGFVNSEDPTAVTTKPTGQTTANTASPAGSYPITGTGAVAANYSINYVAGNLVVSPAPVISASGQTAFLAGDSVILSVNYPAGYTYQWNYNGNAIPGATNPNYTAIISGAYTVSVTANAQTAVSAAANVTATFTLPPQNFQLQINAVTCKGSNNGSVHISAVQHLSYLAVITDANNANTSYSFTDSVTIHNLKPGTYGVCITVNGQLYQQCFSVIITEPKDLSVYSYVNRKLNTVTLQLDGGRLYNVNLNGTAYTTNDTQFTLPLIVGDNKLSVTTDKLCQGIVENTIVINNNTIPYPNPFADVLNVNIGNINVKQIQANVYNIVSGKQVFSNTYTNQSGTVQLDLKNLDSGMYYLNLNLDSTILSFKILKK